MSVGAIQQLIDELAAKLQRSVVVDDPGVKLLYASAHYGDEDEVRLRAVLQRDAGIKTIGYVLAQGVASWTTAGVIPANEKMGLHARVCVPVRWRGDLLGLLMVVDAEGTLTTSELTTITSTGHELATLMIGEHPAAEDEETQARAFALEDLLEGDPPSRRAAVRTLTGSLGDVSERYLRAIEFDVHEGRTLSNPGHVAAGFRHALAASDQVVARNWTLLPLIRDKSAIVLVTSSSAITDKAIDTFAEHLISRVHDVASGRYECNAGVGAAVHGLENARASREQARLACRFAREVARTPVANWADLGEYSLLLRLPLSELTDDALPDELTRLLAIDKDGRMAETLQAFLDHAGSVPATAEALHVHRTTLYYRLDKIRESTGLDLDDGHTRLVLHLGLELRTLLRSIRHL
ncbi:MAG: PucR family transcriptional regulator [Nocardioidaceae bacterium]|nr:PucR family transcriptional regulator [Nocardioidaceae bacterium]